MVAQAKAAVSVETATFDEGEGGIGFKLFSEEAFFPCSARFVG